MTLFEWVRRAAGLDPVAACGASWSCEREANAVINRLGGLRDGGADLFRRCGLPETDEPQAGDIGVIAIERSGRLLHVAAICTGLRWAFPAEPRGLVVVRGDCLIAWAIGKQ